MLKGHNLGDIGKGDGSIRYVYKPYHPWRHGYRREKLGLWFRRIMKLILVAGGIVLAVQYVKTHTFDQVYEREISWPVGESGDGGRLDGSGSGAVFGIGVEPEDGSLFWFHKSTQTVEQPGH